MHSFLSPYTFKRVTTSSESSAQVNNLLEAETISQDGSDDGGILIVENKSPESAYSIGSGRNSQSVLNELTVEDLRKRAHSLGSKSWYVSKIL